MAPAPRSRCRPRTPSVPSPVPSPPRPFKPAGTLTRSSYRLAVRGQLRVRTLFTRRNGAREPVRALSHRPASTEAPARWPQIAPRGCSNTATGACAARARALAADRYPRIRPWSRRLRRRPRPALPRGRGVPAAPARARISSAAEPPAPAAQRILGGSATCNKERTEDREALPQGEQVAAQAPRRVGAARRQAVPRAAGRGGRRCVLKSKVQGGTLDDPGQRRCPEHPRGRVQPRGRCVEHPRRRDQHHGGRDAPLGDVSRISGWVMGDGQGGLRASSATPRAFTAWCRTSRATCLIYAAT